jgi:hypothetical protein
MLQLFFLFAIGAVSLQEKGQRTLKLSLPPATNGKQMVPKNSLGAKLKQ